MKNLIIATFTAAPGQFDRLEKMLIEALPETRAFEGCLSLEVYQEEGTEALTIVEDWESFEHYDRYQQWRGQGDMPALLEEVLQGGMSGFRVQKFRARPDV
jgi:quinol monooxygenase YgiN